MGFKNRYGRIFNSVKYIKYLDLPSVPEHLLDPVDDIINQYNEKMLVREFAHFQYRTINKNLDEWVHSIFKMKCYAKYQVIYNGIPIHKDNPAFPGDRKIAFNYVLDTGGDSVITSVYDDNKILLQSECIPLKTWHSLVVEKYHGVEGIKTVRVALTVTPIL
jgi:hypothetical protein